LSRAVERRKLVDLFPLADVLALQRDPDRHTVDLNEALHRLVDVHEQFAVDELDLARALVGLRKLRGAEAVDPARADLGVGSRLSRRGRLASAHVLPMEQLRNATDEALVAQDDSAPCTHRSARIASWTNCTDETGCEHRL